MPFNLGTIWPRLAEVVRDVKEDIESSLRIWAHYPGDGVEGCNGDVAFLPEVPACILEEFSRCIEERDLGGVLRDATGA